MATRSSDVETGLERGCSATGLNEETTLDSDNRLVAITVPGHPLSMGDYRHTLHHWLRWQHQKECYFVVGDLQLRLLDNTCEDVSESALSRVVDLLAAGVEPGAATLVLESKVSELSELQLLFSGSVSRSWLERAARLENDKESISWAEASVSLLRAASILGLRASRVFAKDETISSLELSRQIARRFNHLYGREDDFESNAEAAIKKLGKKTGKLYKELRKAYRSHGDGDALETARALVQEQSNLTLSDQERLLGYLEGTGVAILSEPDRMDDYSDAANEAPHPELAADHPLFLIPMLAKPEQIDKKVRKIPTDPARAHATDAGNPDHCEVWRLHEEYTLEEARSEIESQCRAGSLGCAECKRRVSDRLAEVFEPMRLKAERYQQDRELVLGLIADAAEESRNDIRPTLDAVRSALDLDYR
ncbi:MAG: tryptophan--tRNA ligase [Oceanospirillaceae bacterium]|nr:tryptophan--tRNA ligase [Oceanospirillaceae bacterium]